MIRDYVKEIVKIIRSTKDADKLKDLLSDYHEKILPSNNAVERTGKSKAI